MDKATGTEPPPSRCPTCGAALENRARCTRCLLLGALETWTEAAAEAEELAAPLSLLQRTEFAGFELLGELGRGGMGVVFKARQKQPARAVALKVIAAGELASPKAIQRFHTEARAAAALHHPNIVSIHEVGEDQGWHYLSMRLVEGRTLADALREGPLPAEAAARLLVKLARAVHHAHQRGILHRDLKPTNILLDAQGEPHLTDFGLAKVASDDSSLTLTNAVLGTPAYMAPEQATGGTRDVTVAADVYGLGAVLYETLSGRPPFAADSTPALLRKIAEEEPAPLKWEAGSRKSEAKSTSHFAPPTSHLTDLSVICLKCLEKEPARRYASASDLADDLERWLRQEPILARPSTRRERVAKWARRNRAVAAALAAIALLLVAGTTISTWQAVRATRAEREQIRLRATEEELRREAEARSYAADLNLAHHALAANNLGRAVGLLNRHRPREQVERSSELRVEREAQAGDAGALPSTLHSPFSPPSTDLRGWEWRYLWQHARSDARSTLATLPHAVASLAVSADGRWLAAGEENPGGLSVFAVADGRRVLAVAGSRDLVFVAFSPRAPLLACSFSTGVTTAGRQYGVRLWDAETQTFTGEFAVSGRVSRLKFSADGETLLVATVPPDNRLSLWRVADRTLLASHPLPGSPHGTVDAAEDLGLAVAAGRTDRLRLLLPRTGLPRWEIPAAEEEVLAVALSPDRRIVASGGAYAETAIRLWDAATGADLGRLDGHLGYVRDLLFLPDGRTLVSASSDQTLRLWDVTTRRALGVLRGHAQEVWSLALLPDGRTLASGAKDGAILTWDLERARKPRTFLTLPAPARSWHFGPDGRTILLLERAGVLSEWSGPDFQERRVLIEVATNLVEGTFSADARWFAARLAGRENQLWEIAGRRRVATFTLPGSTAGLARILGNGTRILLDSAPDGDCHEWDVATATVRQTWHTRPTIYPEALSPDERWRVTLDSSGVGVARDLIARTNRPLALDIEQGDAAAFSPAGRLLAVASTRGYVRLWEWPSLRPAGTLRGFLQGAHTLAFSPDGRRLAAASGGREAVKVWDLATQRELITLEGQGSIFGRMRFSADGNLIGARSGHGILHLWRAPSWEEIAAAEAAAGK